MDFSVVELQTNEEGMISFSTIQDLTNRFTALGARSIAFKRLSENDNRKQQIYVGESPGAVRFLGARWRHDPESDSDIEKADLSFQWVDPFDAQLAPEAKLIYYPQYPEVRLSGFLSGCRLAPSEHLQPIPREDRRGYDDRVLFLGVCVDGRILAHLAVGGTPLAREALARSTSSSLFTHLP